jgi:hypothetical protein
VAVTGFVEKFADIKPERVSLAGPVGQNLSAEVEIFKRKEYPFAIEAVNAKNGHFIKYALAEKCGEDQNRCVVRVENTRLEQGRYVDTLFLKTDNPLRPEIPIQVIGAVQ